MNLWNIYENDRSWFAPAYHAQLSWAISVAGWFFLIFSHSILHQHSKVLESIDIRKRSKSCSGHNPKVGVVEVIRSKKPIYQGVYLTVTALQNTVLRLWRNDRGWFNRAKTSKSQNLELCIRRTLENRSAGTSFDTECRNDLSLRDVERMLISPDPTFHCDERWHAIFHSSSRQATKK